MAADTGTLTVVLVTVFWAAIAIIIPVASFFKNIPNKGVVSVVAAITGFCCWLFWALCYMHQMNPLIGPLLENTTIIALMDIWDTSV
ncbi:V-type proton ATPase subunit e 2 [Armadillidium nasatum]|uniref:V-type proton ATPase subunit e 2 n=1 Tax=Armadillidium nasatum TaxID=96803 RepID=A0A5N5SX33_9CRUS|nr:V-type proton ATPase subunit e 2 [Armadillidium nasatum]